MRRAIPVLAAALLACSDDGGTVGDGGKTPTGDVRLSEAGLPIPDAAAPGTAKVGDPCARDEDCAEPPNAQCFTTVGGGMAPTVVFPGGYCSRGCGNEDASTPDCGASGGCAQIGLSGGGGGSATLSFCAKSCKKNEDCRVAEGYTCRIIFPGFPGVCAPM